MTRELHLPGQGVTLRALEDGVGGRPILIIHGWAGAKEDLADAVPFLADNGWHVVVPDQRGHGESDKPSGAESYSFDILAADGVATADALGWDRFVLMGLSGGGVAAQHLVLRHPERVEALILMDTMHRRPDGVDEAAMELGCQVVTESGMQVLVDLQRDRPDPLETPAHRRVVEERPGYREFGESKTLACAPDMWATLLRELFHQPDRLEQLRSVSVPTLVIVGEQDKPFIEQCRAMAEAIPGAQLAVIPDAGHSPQFENQPAWEKALGDWLDTLPSQKADEALPD